MYQFDIPGPLSYGPRTLRRPLVARSPAGPRSLPWPTDYYSSLRPTLAGFGQDAKTFPGSIWMPDFGAKKAIETGTPGYWTYTETGEAVFNPFEEQMETAFAPAETGPSWWERLIGAFNPNYGNGGAPEYPPGYVPTYGVEVTCPAGADVWKWVLGTAIVVMLVMGKKT